MEELREIIYDQTLEIDKLKESLEYYKMKSEELEKKCDELKEIIFHTRLEASQVQHELKTVKRGYKIKCARCPMGIDWGE